MAALVVIAGRGVERVFKLLIVGADVGNLLFRGRLGRLEDNALPPRRHKARSLLGVAGVSLKLQKIAARDVGGIGGDLIVFHRVRHWIAERPRAGIGIEGGAVERLGRLLQIVDVHPLAPYLHLLGQIVKPLVFLVDVKRDVLSLGRDGNAELPRQRKGDLVAQEGMVLHVGQKAPFFGLAHAKEIGLFRKLDVVGLFGPGPGRVAAALDVVERAVQELGSVFPEDADGARLLVAFVCLHRIKAARCRVNINGRDARCLQGDDPVALPGAGQNRFLPRGEHVGFLPRKQGLLSGLYLAGS